jgi:hypothetical protein
LFPVINSPLFILARAAAKQSAYEILLAALKIPACFAI